MGIGGRTPRGQAGGIDDEAWEFYGGDPSATPGLARPIGWRVIRPDGSGAWDKTGSADTAWTLTLDAWAQTKDGIWLQGNNIRTAVPLPTFYEFTTMVPVIRGQVTVPNAPGTGLATTTLWAWAEWEPAPGDNFEADELAELFGACSFSAQKIRVTQTGV